LSQLLRHKNNLAGLAAELEAQFVGGEKGESFGAESGGMVSFISGEGLSICKCVANLQGERLAIPDDNFCGPGSRCEDIGQVTAGQPLLPTPRGAFGIRADKLANHGIGKHVSSTFFIT
jgi:hypothetical protein